jgi:acyl carrier protein
MDVQLFIIDWFVNKTGLTRNEILEKEFQNYFDLGWMDSFGFIMFLGEIENNLGVTFSNDTFQRREFSTINGLIKIISEVKNGDI